MLDNLDARFAWIFPASLPAAGWAAFKTRAADWTLQTMGLSRGWFGVRAILQALLHQMAGFDETVMKGLPRGGRIRNGDTFVTVATENDSVRAGRTDAGFDEMAVSRHAGKVLAIQPVARPMLPKHWDHE